VRRSPKLTKRAREVITEAMREQGELTTEDAAELVRPHIMFDPQDLMRAETLRVVQRIMRGIKGKAGKRVCFNLKDDQKESQYVNIDTTNSIENLNGIENQLTWQFYGLHKSIMRIDKRRRVLMGMDTETGDSTE